MTTSLTPGFKIIFLRLIEILGKHGGESLQIRTPKPDQFELFGPPTPRSQGREVWFGAVRIGKRYVSYHLMPVYACPDLLDRASPELKRRMQGKSCFNFTRLDESLFQELDTLTKLGYERFKKEGFII
jgi:hypothetical protein